MKNINDTHVLVDERGIAVISGTLEELREIAEACVQEGGWCEICRIDRGCECAKDWNWETMDWGD